MSKYGSLMIAKLLTDICQIDAILIIQQQTWMYVIHCIKKKIQKKKRLLRKKLTNALNAGLCAVISYIQHPGLSDFRDQTINP